MSLGAGPPAEQRSAGDEGGGKPGTGEENDADGAARKKSRVCVADIARDEPVAVERDDDDVENGRRTAEHVRRDPQVADVLTECPAAGHLILQQHIHTRAYNSSLTAL